VRGGERVAAHVLKAKAAPEVPQRVLELAREYRETEDPKRQRELKNEAYKALVEARITSISRMVAVVREHFGEGG
jgi:hypothetical protein